jgi:hypothetical protein
MNYVGLGIVVGLLFLVFLGLYFWSSGALIIDQEEKKDIERISPEELTKEIELEKELEAAELKQNDDPDYSRG